MYAATEPPHHHRRLAPGRGVLASLPGLDLRHRQIKNQCVNRFRLFFLSELVLHYNGVGAIDELDVSEDAVAASVVTVIIDAVHGVANVHITEIYVDARCKNIKIESVGTVVAARAARAS